ncbi:hypothetical protein AVEN_268418-1 [Araneus ventricosus]|uniref:Uncharacterized protein n=1 Tax=Araneus ventricosus TaxID=182803 RepID=A0A4Y2DVK5_ARAVE|nr:hypothetical protein AVEN_268418-1 [Araneus ventricosus]
MSEWQSQIRHRRVSDSNFDSPSWILRERLWCDLKRRVFACKSKGSRTAREQLVHSCELSVWFKAISSRIACGEPNPVGFFANAKGLSVHVGACSSVVRRSAQNSFEPARSNLQTKAYSKALTKNSLPLVTDKR